MQNQAINNAEGIKSIDQSYLFLQVFFYFLQHVFGLVLPLNFKLLFVIKQRVPQKQRKST